MNIWISGSINSGKTAAASLLQQKLNCAVVELDAFSDFLPHVELEKKIQINLELAVKVTQIYNTQGFNVILVYPLSKRDFEYINERIGNLKVFTLAPSLQIASSNRGGRILTENEVRRVKRHYEIGIANPDFGHIIDTTHLTAEETTNRILEVLNQQL